MKNLAKITLLCAVVLAASGCDYQKQYECTITDPATGKVIKKVKVNYKSECNAIALGV